MRARPPPPELFQGPNLSRTTLSASKSPQISPQPSPLLPPVQRPRAIGRTSTWTSLGHISRSADKNKADLNETERTEALWAKMQLTLEEVEMSAAATTHVFGAAHNSALEELRAAQIDLARTWSKAEAEDVSPPVLDRPHNASGETGQDNLVEAGLRRRENARLYDKVRADVSDLAGKLDGVAQAMTKVERESHEVWDEASRDSEGSLNP